MFGKIGLPRLLEVLKNTAGQLSFFHHPTHRHWFGSAGWRYLLCLLAPPHILCWGAPLRFITRRHHLPHHYWVGGCGKEKLCSQGGQTRSWAKMATKGAYPTIHLYNITVMQSNSCFIRLLRQLSFFHHPTHRHWFWSAGWRYLLCLLAPPHILCWGAPLRFITRRHHLPLCYCAALHLAHVTSTLPFTNT